MRFTSFVELCDSAAKNVDNFFDKTRPASKYLERVDALLDKARIEKDAEIRLYRYFQAATLVAYVQKLPSFQKNLKSRSQSLFDRASKGIEKLKPLVKTRYEDALQQKELYSNGTASRESSASCTSIDDGDAASLFPSVPDDEIISGVASGRLSHSNEELLAWSRGPSCSNSVEWSSVESNQLPTPSIIPEQDHECSNTNTGRALVDIDDNHSRTYRRDEKADSQPQNEIEHPTNITPEEFHSLMKECLIVDIRLPSRFRMADISPLFVTVKKINFPHTSLRQGMSLGDICNELSARNKTYLEKRNCNKAVVIVTENQHEIELLSQGPIKWLLDSLHKYAGDHETTVPVRLLEGGFAALYHKYPTDCSAPPVEETGQHRSQTNFTIPDLPKPRFATNQADIAPKSLPAQNRSIDSQYSNTSVREPSRVDPANQEDTNAHTKQYDKNSVVPGSINQNLPVITHSVSSYAQQDPSVGDNIDAHHHRRVVGVNGHNIPEIPHSMVAAVGQIQAHSIPSIDMQNDGSHQPQPFYMSETISPSQTNSNHSLTKLVPSPSAPPVEDPSKQTLFEGSRLGYVPKESIPATPPPTSSTTSLDLPSSTPKQRPVRPPPKPPITPYLSDSNQPKHMKSLAEPVQPQQSEEQDIHEERLSKLILKTESIQPSSTSDQDALPNVNGDSDNFCRTPLQREPPQLPPSYEISKDERYDIPPDFHLSSNINASEDAAISPSPSYDGDISNNPDDSANPILRLTENASHATFHSSSFVNGQSKVKGASATDIKKVKNQNPGIEREPSTSSLSRQSSKSFDNKDIPKVVNGKIVYPRRNDSTSSVDDFKPNSTVNTSALNAGKLAYSNAIDHDNETRDRKPMNMPPARDPPAPPITKPSYIDNFNNRKSTTRQATQNSKPRRAATLDNGSSELAHRKAKPLVDRSTKPAFAITVGRSRPELALLRLQSMRPIQSSYPISTGLRNLGNTCYMNTILQCLARTNPLATYLTQRRYRNDLNRTNKLGCKGEVAEELAELFTILLSRQNRHISPIMFKDVFGSYCSQFANYDQQDCQEFASVLLDKLHEDLNRVVTKPKSKELDLANIDKFMAGEMAWKNYLSRDNSMIVDLFQGQFRSTIQCCACKYESATYSPFTSISLPVPKYGRCTLNNCIREFARGTMMTGNNRWHCPKCNCYRDARSRIGLWRLPRYLIVHLKRFYFDGPFRDKINTMVDFPATLRLTHEHVMSYEHSSREKVYSLYAVANHYGTLSGGHYIAFAKDNQRWEKYDDSQVSTMSLQQVVSPAAYVLFYSTLQE